MRLVFRTVTLVLATAFAAEVVAAQDVPVPPGVVPGQTPGQAGIERGLWSNITVGGSTEVFSEMYRVAGRDPRRPGETARLNLRPQINFGRAFTVGADILLSTEGSSFGASGRQRVNRLGLNPTWSWGSVHIGDFSDALSPLTYEGIPVRGGAVKLEPGLLRFAVLGGVTQRAIAGDASNGSFGRRLFAGRLGIGQSEASYADVVLLWADDDVGSLTAEQQFIDRDTLEVGERVGSSSVTPQQNLVAGLDTRLAILDRRLVVKAEVAGAAYTRDKRASLVPEADLESVPSWMTNLFTPRVGSNVDVAARTSAELRLQGLMLHAGYEYVGPGYRSLGLGSLLVDREELLGRATYAAGKVTASVAASTQHDNVTDQKQHTTRRTMLTTTTGYRIRPNLMLTVRGASNRMSRGADEPTGRINYANRSAGVGLRVAIRRTYLKTVAIDYRVQRASDANPDRMADFTTHQVLVPVGLQFGKAFSVTPHVGIVRLRHPVDGWRLTHTEKVALRHSNGNRRWVTTLVAGTSFADGARRLVATATTQYRMRQTTLKLELRRNDYRPGSVDDAVSGAGQEAWQEFTARLSLQQALGRR